MTEPRTKHYREDKEKVDEKEELLEWVSNLTDDELLNLTNNLIKSTETEEKEKSKQEYGHSWD